ncbi:MAG: hypothetical protein IJ125_08040 [Atopobiaceae bacterium]|nr:hypothetical protein [Atopobiaceae bacterium]
MGRIQLIYHSETGFTERYARWIANELNCDCVRFDKSITVDVSKADDVLIIGSPVHGGELARKRDIERIVSHAGQAQVMCFATGVAEAEEGIANSLLKASFTDPTRISLTYLPGGFDSEKLEQRTKTLLFLLRLMLKHRRNLSEKQKLLLRRTEVSGDYTDKELIGSFVSEVMRQVKS